MCQTFRITFATVFVVEMSGKETNLCKLQGFYAPPFMEESSFIEDIHLHSMMEKLLRGISCLILLPK